MATVPITTRRLVCLGIVTLALLGGTIACAGDERKARAETKPVPDVQFTVSSGHLPACSTANDGAVWYVWTDKQFYVCKGPTRVWTVTNINGYDAAVSVVPLEPGSVCATEGANVQFGLDTNRNGRLDAAEVTSTVNLCNGMTGAQGQSGPQGASGRDGQDCWDLNSNGLCDAPSEDKNGNGTCEVADCQGQNGMNGAAGLNSLVAVEVEPAGTNCVAGGTKIQVGVDTNVNGTLDASEVNQTQFVCNARVDTGSGGTSSTDAGAAAGDSSTGSSGSGGGVEPMGETVRWAARMHLAVLPQGGKRCTNGCHCRGSGGGADWHTCNGAMALDD